MDIENLEKKVDLGGKFFLIGVALFGIYTSLTAFNEMTRFEDSVKKYSKVEVQEEYEKCIGKAYKGGIEAGLGALGLIAFKLVDKKYKVQR